MRSQIIGMILGSMALGVLLGYPFGGILYAFSGKSAPFFIIAALTFVVLGKVCDFFSNSYRKNVANENVNGKKMKSLGLKLNSTKVSSYYSVTL